MKFFMPGNHICKMSPLVQGLRIFLFFSILSLILSQSVNSQSKTQKILIYKAWVNYIDSPIKMKGYLYQVKDSSIVISGVKPVPSITIHKNHLYEISYKHIDVIKIRRKGRVGRGILIGMGSGFLAGIMIGYISGDDEPSYWITLTAEEKAIAAAVPLAITGGIIGWIVGTNKKKIYVSGNFDNFRINRTELIP